MAALTGSLTSIALRPLLHLLGELRKTGRLVISDGISSGALFLEDGRVVGAVCGPERGLSSLDLIVLAMGDGDFEFDENVGERELNLVIEQQELEQHLMRLLEERAELALLVPSPMVVPRVRLDDSDPSGKLELSRKAVRLLLAIDGRRRVADLAGDMGLVATVRNLAELAKLGLVQFGPEAVEPSRQPPRSRVNAARPEVTPEQELEAAPEAPTVARPNAAARPRGTWPGWRRPND